MLPKLTKLDSNWLKLTTIDYNCLKLTAIWLKLPKEWEKNRLAYKSLFNLLQKVAPGRRDEPLDTREWQGTKNPQPLLGNRKKDVNVTGNSVLEFNFVTFTSPLHFLLFEDDKPPPPPPKKKKNETKVAKLLTYSGQIIDRCPIYIYMHIYIYIYILF